MLLHCTAIELCCPHWMDNSNGERIASKCEFKPCIKATPCSNAQFLVHGMLRELVWLQDALLLCVLLVIENYSSCKKWRGKFLLLLNVPFSWPLTWFFFFWTEWADVLVLWGSPLLQRVVLTPPRAGVCSASVNMFCSISPSTESRNCSWISLQKGQLCQYKEQLVQSLLSSLCIIRTTKMRKELFKPHWTVTLKTPQQPPQSQAPNNWKTKASP